MSSVKVFMFLGVFGGLFGTSTGAHAFQSRIVRPCVVKGPNLSETLAYLNESGTKGVQFSYSHAEGILTRITEQARSKDDDTGFFRMTESAPVLALNCSTYATERQQSSYFYYACRNAVTCVLMTRERLVRDGGSDPTHPSSSVQAGHFMADPARADRYARALSHLIFLVQHEYVLSHTPKNDPFSKVP